MTPPPPIFKRKSEALGTAPGDPKIGYEYGYENGYDGENCNFPPYIAKRYTFSYSYTNSRQVSGTAPDDPKIGYDYVYGYGYDGENSHSPPYIAKRYPFPYSYTNSQGGKVVRCSLLSCSLVLRFCLSIYFHCPISISDNQQPNNSTTNKASPHLKSNFSPRSLRRGHQFPDSLKDEFETVIVLIFKRGDLPGQGFNR